MRSFLVLFFSMVVGCFSITRAQNNTLNGGSLTGAAPSANDYTPISTAVPFLNITPDARAASMGDVGVATSPDAFSTYWNPAKLAFIDNKVGGAITYNPWLRKLVGDMSLSYLTAHYRLRKEDVVAFSMTYFDLGSLQFTYNDGSNGLQFNPREFIFAGTYSRQLGKGFSAGLTAKYIYSNLTGNISNSTDLSASPASTGAADLGFYWNRDAFVQGQKLNIALGVCISNVGGKVSYSNTDRADYIPTNMRLGYALTYEIDDYNKIVWATDFNKLMVPSRQPEYNTDSSGNRYFNGNYTMPQKGIVSSMFSSFGDAPGGFKEELREVMWSSGLEYWYNDIFAVRGGYFNEAATKGNRKYFGLGFGFKYQVIGLDFGYLIAVGQNSPLAETLRFALNFNFQNKSAKPEESVVE